jgi:hypothetical protein
MSISAFGPLSLRYKSLSVYLEVGESRLATLEGGFQRNVRKQIYLIKSIRLE